MLYAFSWVIPQRLNFIYRRFGTLCMFHLHRQVGVKEKVVARAKPFPLYTCILQHFSNLVICHTYLPMKMEQSECSETSAYKIHTLENYPEEIIQAKIWFIPCWCWWRRFVSLVSSETVWISGPRIMFSEYKFKKVPVPGINPRSSVFVALATRNCVSLTNGPWHSNSPAPGSGGDQSSKDTQLWLFTHMSNSFPEVPRSRALPW